MAIWIPHPPSEVPSVQAWGCRQCGRVEHWRGRRHPPRCDGGGTHPLTATGLLEQVRPETDNRRRFR